MLRFGKQRGSVIVVADIGSGSAGVAILETGGEGPARVLATQRSSLPFEDRSPEATASGIIAQLEDAAQKALAAYSAKRGKAPHVGVAYAVIRAPWVRSKTMQASSQFPQDTRIEEQMIGTLGQEALKQDPSLAGANVFETSVVRVLLNGYPTAKPKGKRAHHLQVSLLVSDCVPTIRTGVLETLTKVFACPPATLRSGSRALLSVLRESALLPKECVVMNMTSQGTSVLVVRKGVVVETTMVAEGSRSILKRVAGATLPEEALTLIRLLALDQCEAEACDAIRKALAQAEPDLVKVFGEAFVKMSSSRRLPNNLILVAHEDLSLWLARFFSRIDFAQFTVTTRPFSTRALSGSDLLGLTVFDPAVKLDAGLSLASALVNIEEHSS